MYIVLYASNSATFVDVTYKPTLALKWAFKFKPFGGGATVTSYAFL